MDAPSVMKSATSSVYFSSFEGFKRAVDVQVNRLRRKIERDPANPLFVQTVRGIGYRLVVSP